MILGTSGGWRASQPVAQSQKTASACFTSKQTLPFGFAGQRTAPRKTGGPDFQPMTTFFLAGAAHLDSECTATFILFGSLMRFLEGLDWGPLPALSVLLRLIDKTRQ